MNFIFEPPHHLDLLSFFGKEPIHSFPDEGFWMYEFEDKNGNILHFSYNIFERSVQITIHSFGREMCMVSQEGVTDMYIDKEVLYANFNFGDYGSKLQLKLVKNEFTVHWGNIRTK